MPSSYVSGLGITAGRQHDREMSTQEQRFTRKKGGSRCSARL